LCDAGQLLITGTDTVEVRCAQNDSNSGGVIVDLDNRIARLDMLAEQLAIHLQALKRNASEAAAARSELYALLQELAQLKAERERREALLEEASTPLKRA
jgi:hypothetical protein